MSSHRVGGNRTLRRGARLVACRPTKRPHARRKARDNLKHTEYDQNHQIRMAGAWRTHVPESDQKTNVQGLAILPPVMISLINKWRAEAAELRRRADLMLADARALRARVPLELSVLVAKADMLNACARELEVAL